MENNREAIAALLESRCVALSAMGYAFADQPDVERVSLFAGDEAAEAFEVFSTPGSALGELVAALRELPREGEGRRPSEAFVELLRKEYFSLFIGPLKVLAPPWESVYLDPRELLFLESTAEVRKCYEAEGYRVSTDGRQAEDHLSFQLDFMGRLAGKMLDAFTHGDADEYSRLLAVQRDFEQSHMLNWLPAFAKRAEKSPTSHLYPALCAGVADLLATDAMILAELEE